MLPVPYRVAARRSETHDSVTLRLEPVGAPMPLSARAVHDAVRARRRRDRDLGQRRLRATPTARSRQTIRDVGAVQPRAAPRRPGTSSACAGRSARTGAWRPPPVATGHRRRRVGLAPLRPVLLGALADRSAYGRVVLVAGARGPGGVPVHATSWRPGRRRAGLEVRAHRRPCRRRGWTGPVGFVTEPLARLRAGPGRTTAFLCGPEPMMRFSAKVLLGKGHVAIATSGSRWSAT